MLCHTTLSWTRLVPFHLRYPSFWAKCPVCGICPLFEQCRRSVASGRPSPVCAFIFASFLRRVPLFCAACKVQFIFIRYGFLSHLSLLVPKPNVGPFLSVLFITLYDGCCCRTLIAIPMPRNPSYVLFALLISVNFIFTFILILGLAHLLLYSYCCATCLAPEQRCTFTVHLILLSFLGLAHL